MKTKAVVGAFLSVVVSGASFGATLYSEAVSGDAGDIYAPKNISIGLGQNIIEGTTSVLAGNPDNLDLDAFSFQLLAGQSISSISFSFFNSLLTDSGQLGGGVYFYSGSHAPSVTYLGELEWLARAEGSIYGSSSTSPVSFVPAAPLHAGFYSIAIETNSWGGGGAVPYSVEFNVSPVPEPEIMSMLAVGAGLLGAAKLRRKRKYEQA